MWFFQRSRERNSIICYKGGKQAIFTEDNICCTSGTRTAKLHDVKSTFLLCNGACEIEYFLSIWQTMLEKKLWKTNFGKKYFETKIYHIINQCHTIFALLVYFDRNREKDREYIWTSILRTSIQQTIPTFSAPTFLRQAWLGSISVALEAREWSDAF